MLADILKRDIRQYEARGIRFAPEDIVRLNALAVGVSLCQRPTAPVNLPRCAFLPRPSMWRRGVVLREPTIVHEAWLEQAARWIDTSDGCNYLWVNGYALSVFDPLKLADVLDPRRVVRAVYKFAAKRLAGYTVRQLRDAVDYVKYGADWRAGELPVPRKDADGMDGARRGDVPSPILGLIANGRALGVGITAEDARRMTASELEQTIHRAMVAAGHFDRADARNAAMGDYVRTRDAIIARITAEKGASE